MDIITEFTSGRVAIVVDKENETEIDELYSIIEPLVGDIRLACCNTLYDYLHSQWLGPVHFIDNKNNCFNGATVKYFEIHPSEDIRLTSAKTFIKNYNEYMENAPTDNDFYSIIGA